MSDSVISVRGLRKSYDELEAVRGIDLEVFPEEIFAVLGPNGAGKTTTVEILEGYRDRDAGEVSVLGVDPASPTPAWRERIGIVLQSTTLEPALSVRESLQQYAGYYREPRDVDEVIELVGLGEQAGVRARKLSGGQQRRLDVGIALVGDPDLLFLDEPTTGFDPSARRQAWEMVAGLRELGKTVLLTTHYMEEAQFLADRVAIVSAGEIVALDTPENLGDRRRLPTTITFTVASGTDLSGVGTTGRPEASGQAEDGRVAVRVSTHEPVADLNRLTAWSLEGEIELEQLEVRRPSLEDVYLELTEA
ncbi:MAG: ABC transporter ATP-binding protein [Solirubrobacterales bacterium]|nr:ABC transporter ATP-binding protein [Solirubrobacterales bacterium]OJU95451.1 MAG: ABC transporter [Solirubrobacterales bacterium 67-14]